MVQVNVPTAQMEEILPAARLLSRATSPSPSDYGRAKAAFIQGVHEVSLQAKVFTTAPRPEHKRLCQGIQYNNERLIKRSDHKMPNICRECRSWASSWKPLLSLQGPS